MSYWAIPVLASILILGLGGLDPAFATSWGVSLGGNGNAQECDAEGCYADVLYDISGSYSFDINSNNGIQGTGNAQVTLTSQDYYCTGSQTYSVSFLVSGNYLASSDTVQLIISNPTPSPLVFVQHCDYTSEEFFEPEPDEPGGPIFDETIYFPSPFNFQHDIGPGLVMGRSASGEFSVGTGFFWMGSDISSVGTIASPAADSDGDGVPDSSDLCPQEYGTQLDGCPLDSDGDGVPDNIDQCDNTPDEGAVDEVGCSPSQLDSDGDGVPNSSDACPNEYGAQSNGCPGVQDTSPPTLVDFSFTPSTVDVSSGPATVQVTIHVTDDVSGYLQGQVFFQESLSLHQ